MRYPVQYSITYIRALAYQEHQKDGAPFLLEWQSVIAFYVFQEKIKVGEHIIINITFRTFSKMGG